MRNVSKFEFVDVGAGPVDVLDIGPSFREYEAEVLGNGGTASEAMECALRYLSEDGFETELIREQAVEAGFFSAEAMKPAKEFAEEDDDIDCDWEYVVLIRFNMEGSTQE